MSSSRLEQNKVASRYARALFDSLSGTGDLEQVRQELQLVVETLAQVPGFYDFMDNPSIGLTDKLELTEAQLVGDVNPWLGRLIRLMVENGRLTVLPQLLEHLEALIHQQQNTTQAEIVTAVELEPALQERLQKTLEQVLGFNQVHLQNRVDPGILGGAIIKIQDRVIDGSYVGRLEELRKQLVRS